MIARGRTGSGKERISFELLDALFYPFFFNILDTVLHLRVGVSAVSGVPLSTVLQTLLQYDPEREENKWRSEPNYKDEMAFVCIISSHTRVLSQAAKIRSSVCLEMN